MRMLVLGVVCALLVAVPNLVSAEEPLPAVTVVADPGSEWPDWVADRHALQVSAMAFAQGGELVAELQPGQRFLLRPIDIEKRSPGRFAWRGHVVAGDRVVGGGTLTFHDGRVMGMLRIRGEEYHLSSDPRGHQWLDRLDPDARPPIHPEGAPYVPEDMAGKLPEVEPVRMQEQASPVVDVMVFYTQAAMGYYLDEEQTRLAIQNAVDINNTAFINSNVEGRVRLVGSFPWDYQETGTGSDVLEVSRTSEYVTDLQDRHSADLVATITSDTDVCGVAWLLTGYTNSWTHGYSMTSATPACLGSQTFAHELGHNMGLSHDTANADEPEVLIEPFSYGYLVDYEFRTIMSYWNQCVQGSQGCPQIDHFSDPDVTDPDSGLPTGTEDHNNAEVLRRVMPYVSQWRVQPATLGEAGGDAAHEFSTGGDSTWVAQDVLVPDGSSSALMSGPVYADEVSWLELESAGSAGDGVVFQLHADVADSRGILNLYADDALIESYSHVPDEWVSRSASVPEGTAALRWEWVAETDATQEEVGVVAMTNLQWGNLVESRYYGTAINQQGEAVSDLHVSAHNESDEKIGNTVATGEDGSFQLTIAHQDGAPPQALWVEGVGAVGESYSLDTNGCQTESNPCELLVTGESREIAGTVDGMLAGESVELSLGADLVVTILADASGAATFSQAADALVMYGPLSIDDAGYSLSSDPVDSIDVRTADITDLAISLGTEFPSVHAVETVETGTDAITVRVDVDTHQRDTVLRLTVGEGEDARVEEHSLSGMEGTQTANMTVGGLDCGTRYDYSVTATNDHDQRRTGVGNGKTSACSGSSGSSGCSLGSDSRQDPVLLILMFLALLRLASRRI